MPTGKQTMYIVVFLTVSFSVFKLMHTNLNYRIVGTSNADIFLPNDHSLYANITSDECHAWFHFLGPVILPGARLKR